MELQIDHCTAHIPQKKDRRQNLRQPLWALANYRQFDDVVVEQTLSQFSGVFECENDRERREEWCGTPQEASRSESMASGGARDHSVDEQSQRHEVSESIAGAIFVLCGRRWASG